MERTKFTVTLAVETDCPVALDVLQAALRNPAEAVRTKRRFDICLERAVNVADSPEWHYIVKEIAVQGGTDR